MSVTDAMQDILTARRACDRYKEQFPSFQDARECKFLEVHAYSCSGLFHGARRMTKTVYAGLADGGGRRGCREVYEHSGRV